MNEAVTDIEILNSIRENSILLPNINAESSGFNFEQLIYEFQIHKPDYININWDRFEDIDTFKLKNFSDYFEYIWYAGPDDIEIFPDDISWIISIDAMGSIYLYK